jgi:hypothetical protein
MFCKLSNLVSFVRLTLVFAWNSTSAAFQMALNSADDVIFSVVIFSAMMKRLCFSGKVFTKRMMFLNQRRCEELEYIQSCKCEQMDAFGFLSCQGLALYMSRSGHETRQRY